MSSDDGSTGAVGHAAGATRTGPPPPSLVIGLAVSVVALGAFIAWMLTQGGQTDAQRQMRELDSPASPQPTGEPPSIAAEGRAIYDSKCISCHGPRLAGTELGPALRAKRYTPPRWENQDLANVVYGGRGAMPGYSEQLTTEQLAELVAYIRWEQGLEVPEFGMRSPPPKPTP